MNSLTCSRKFIFLMQSNSSIRQLLNLLVHFLSTLNGWSIIWLPSFPLRHVGIFSSMFVTWQWRDVKSKHTQLFISLFLSFMDFKNLLAFTFAVKYYSKSFLIHFIILNDIFILFKHSFQTTTGTHILTIILCCNFPEYGLILRHWGTKSGDILIGQDDIVYYQHIDTNHTCYNDTIIWAVLEYVIWITILLIYHF